jgi:site-specific DNA recombinase
MKEILYIYCRVSSEIQKEHGFSLIAQKETGIKKATELGFDYELFEEGAASSKFENLDNRPKLKNLLHLVESKIAKNIFVIEDSRLSRNLTVSNELMSLFLKYGVILYTQYEKTDFGSIDYQTKFRKNLNSLLSNYENEQRIARSKAGKLVAVRQGKYAGGMCNYGYTTDEKNNLIIDNEEKEVYLKMVELSLSGMGAERIARKLTEMNVPTKAFKSYTKKNGIHLKDRFTGEIYFKDKSKFIWKKGSVEAILKNSIYKGARIFKDEIINAPKIIDEITWQRIQDNFVNNRSYSQRNAKKHFYLLRGLMFCPRCSRPLWGNIKESEPKRVYYCSSKSEEDCDFCGMKSINIDLLNKLIWEKLVYVLSNSSITRKRLKCNFLSFKNDKNKIQKEINYLKNKLKESDSERSQLIRLASKGSISDEDLEKNLNNISKEKTEFESKIKLCADKLSYQDKEQSAYSWLLHLENKSKELFFLKDEILKQKILRTFVDKIMIEFLEREKQHVIELSLKIPLYNDGTNSHLFLLNGSDVSNLNENEILSVSEKYELLEEAESEKEVVIQNKNKQNIVTGQRTLLYLAEVELMEQFIEQQDQNF